MFVDMDAFYAAFYDDSEVIARPPIPPRLCGDCRNYSYLLGGCVYQRGPRNPDESCNNGLFEVRRKGE